ncbi:hypothetical protein EYF80_023773 [Liparis tanakae]|uniref:Uncharacterized protein n=1 Tax=Liparis tanakae TaxID=230148 RepID=A0A4Z2HJR1_9TELE|nr:hypothetical protein EYF80_023773 [Liparis tanakae]
MWSSLSRSSFARRSLTWYPGIGRPTSLKRSPSSEALMYPLPDGVTCCCGERDALPLIEEASRDQLGALEPEEPYMAREPDVKYLKGALQGETPQSRSLPLTPPGEEKLHRPLRVTPPRTKPSSTFLKSATRTVTLGVAARPKAADSWTSSTAFLGELSPQHADRKSSISASLEENNTAANGQTYSGTLFLDLKSCSISLQTTIERRRSQIHFSVLYQSAACGVLLARSSREVMCESEALLHSRLAFPRSPPNALFTSRAHAANAS